MKKSHCILASALLLASVPAWAGKSCDELKTEIAAKLDAKGVKNYVLDVLPAAEVKDQKVVGSCEGGSRKIAYSKTAAMPPPPENPPPAVPVPAPIPAPAATPAPTQAPQSSDAAPTKPN